MYPTRRAILLFAAGIPVGLFFILGDDGSWTVAMMWLVLSFVLLGLDGVMALRPSDLELEIYEPALLYIGDSDPLMLRVGAPASRDPVRIDALIDLGPQLARLDPVSFVISQDAGAEHAFTLTPLHRGAAKVNALTLRWRGPMGLMMRQTDHEIGLEIPIVPNVRAVRQAAIEFFSRDARFGMKVQQEAGAGSEFNALREYMSGMERRFIDWKHSARHRRLVAKEYRTERNHQILLAVDTGHLMREPLGGVSRLDHAVNAALMLGYVSLRYGDRIGVFGFDSGVRLYAEPVGGVQAFPRLQRSMAQLDYHTDETNFTLGLTSLAGRLNRRSLIILMSEFVDVTTAELMLENVSRLVRRHLVLFVTFRDPAMDARAEAEPGEFPDVTRAVVAEDFLRERQVVLERLRRMGVLIVDSPVERLSTALLNRYLAIQQRELI